MHPPRSQDPHRIFLAHRSLLWPTELVLWMDLRFIDALFHVHFDAQRVLEVGVLRPCSAFVCVAAKVVGEELSD